MFLPPEISSGDGLLHSMKKGDVWSLGISLYNMTFNRFPFETGKTELETMDNIVNFYLTFDGRDISEPLKELLTAMLEKDPNRRASASDLMKFEFIREEPCSDEISLL